MLVAAEHGAEHGGPPDDQAGAEHQRPPVGVEAAVAEHVGQDDHGVRDEAEPSQP